MKITPLRTCIVEVGTVSLFDFLDTYLTGIQPFSIVAITSKVISICQGRVVPIAKADKFELVKQEAEYYLPAESSKYNVMLSIKSGLLTPSAGIDESNSNGNYVLWPENVQLVANQIRGHLSQRFKVRELGVLITDSGPAPLKAGVVGSCIAHSGFQAVNNHIGDLDLFGRTLQMTKVNVADALASAAVLTMGETNEQMPVAVLNDLPFVKFIDNDPSEKDLANMRMPMEDDLYGPLFTSVSWKQGLQNKDNFT